METSTALPSPSPQWLENFLNTIYYEYCNSHNNFKTSNTCNYYCTDCVRPICPSCKSSDQHHQHVTLQIRTASQACSVRARDVEGLIVTAGVHKFKINGYDIHFLRGRSDGSEGKRKAPTLSGSQCVACGWVLPGGKDQSSRFCSIKCKLIGSPLRREASNHEGVPEPFNKPCEEKNKDGHEGLQGTELVFNNKSFRIRRRKGTPHRSPLS